MMGRLTSRWRQCRHSLAVATLATIAAAAATEPRAQSTVALENDQISILYSPPQSTYLQPLYERLRKRQYLEQLKQFLSPLKVPPGIRLKITTKECGTVNSWWSGREDGLFLCYEWPDYAERIAPIGATPEGMTREDAILGAFLQVTFHELGHAIFDIYEVPIFGREEDAADQMAGFILSQFGPEVARRTFPGTVYIWKALNESTGNWSHDVFSDIHGQPLQRAYNYLCMAYGAAPDLFQYVVADGLLPEARAVGCSREFKQIQHAFISTVYPHIDQAKMKVVMSTQWLRPEGKELPPE
jgi:Putative metallopeptidase